MNLPNYITLFRILLSPVFLIFLIYGKTNDHFRIAALSIFIFGCFTDALDGLLARLRKERTDLGRFLDPLADKLLLLSAFLGLLAVNSLPYRPPLWVTITVVFRDLVILVGLITLLFMNGKIEVIPNFLGKITTTFQMATIIAALIKSKITLPISYVTALLTMFSCLSYLKRDLKKLRVAA